MNKDKIQHVLMSNNNGIAQRGDEAAYKKRVNYAGACQTKIQNNKKSLTKHLN